MRRCENCFSEINDELEMCPFCGYYEDMPMENGVALRPGTRIADRYTVGKVIGSGGFGFTYLAWDDTLQQRVAIREYLPSEFSTRSPGQKRVSVFQGEKNEQYLQGLEKFIEESRKLAKFQNEEGIVKTFDCISENDTAYIIMEYLEGQTLAEYLQKHHVIPEADAVRMLTPIMESLVTVHEAGILHRDIAPENIFICEDGSAKLIDFSASRFASATHSRSLTVMVKPGFSPEEQYRSMGEHGPHSDVYSVAATLYKMVTGITPPDALERRAKVENSKKDMLVDPGKINKKVSRVFENAVMNALNVQIADRTKTMQQFIKDLHAETPVKRVYGKIKRIDLYRWPLWAKILVPSVAAVLLLFVILYLTGVISFSNMFKKESKVPEGYVIVPKVVGMSMEKASSVMEKNHVNYLVTGNTKSEYVPENMIVDQDPGAGAYVLENTPIKVVISKGNGEIKAAENGVATVPYILFAQQEDAKNDLSTAGLSYAILEEYSATAQANTVARMTLENGDPVEPGDQLPEGTIIYLYISKGQEGFAMPDLSGLTEAEARQKVSELGLVVTGVNSGENSSVESGRVYQQSVAPGTIVTKGSEISFTVAVKANGSGDSSASDAKETDPTSQPAVPTPTSAPASTGTPTPSPAPTPTTAPETVPSVVGMAKAEAVSVLQAEGLKVDVQEASDEDVAAGYVIRQTPAAGTEKKSVASVTITVSTGKKDILVHLDSNGAGQDLSDITVHLKDPYGDLPVPTRSGYGFDGWYTSATGGDQIAPDTLVSVSDAHTLYAHWSAGKVTLTFNGNGGYASAQSMTVTFDSPYGTLPTASRDYYDFNGWYTAASGGQKVTSSTVAKGSTTLYAQWTQHPVSDWVLASNVPAGAEIVSTKYAFTLREYTSSSSSSVSGWTKYDTKRTGWGAKQGPVYTNPSNGSRNVTSEQYETSRTTYYHYYHRYNSSTKAGGPDSLWPNFPRHTLVTTRELPFRKYANEVNQTPEYGDSNSKCGKCINWGVWFKDTPFETYDIKYGTRWYYQEPVYTYYFYRDVSKEETSDPSGQANVSNVKKYVKYRAK